MVRQSVIAKLELNYQWTRLYKRVRVGGREVRRRRTTMLSTELFNKMMTKLQNNHKVQNNKVGTKPRRLTNTE